MKLNRFCLVWLLLGAALCLNTPAQSGRSATAVAIPAPESVLGFKIGADRRLAKWEQFVTYFNQLAATSNRVKVTTLGRTTLGRPFIVATITASENLKQLDALREIQATLADPRLLRAGRPDAQRLTLNELISRGKTVVVITCSIHSTEVGGAFTATELAYRLASSNTPDIQQILDNVIVLLVPSLNPDGTDIVADWYQKTVNTPAEGTAPPELYHHYTGHDNNRDWYAFTQIETQLTVDKILNVWRPQILHDIHQMGGSAARLFVPPYVEPWEPNVDPAITSGVNALGSAMAWDVIAQGKSGVVINGIYDAWTPARAYAHYHAGLRILSETASARLATPVDVPFERLSAGIGYHAQKQSWNFPEPWPGGRWTIRDIIDYQQAAAMALLTHAARYREQYLRNFYHISQRAIAPKQNLHAYLLPEPELPAELAAAAKQLKEDVRSRSTQDEQKHTESDEAIKKITGSPATSAEVNYFYKIEGLDRVLSILKRGGVEVLRAREAFTADGKRYPAGAHIVPMNQPYAAFAKTLLERQVYPDLREYPGGPPRRPYDVVAHTLPLLMNVSAIAVKEPFKVETQREPFALVLQSRVRSNPGVRVGLYQNYLPSMDEGWTRWLFDQYKFPFTRLLHQEIRQGKLREKYDAIILPDQSATALFDGLGRRSSRGDEETTGAYPEQYTGGLGEAGVKSLREFIEAGGTLVTFNNASNFAIEYLNVPVRNVLKGVSPRDFYCPGSILRTELDSANALTFGMEPESIAWFETSPVFEVTDSNAVKVIARYPDGASPLLSGWILGDQLLHGKAAMVEATMGKGRVVMFGFRPQYRGQSLATVPLIFNAILTSKTE
jgi:hypothetical protein